jgi:hypothetical protein
MLPGEVHGQQVRAEAVQLLRHARGGDGFLPGRHVLQHGAEGVRLQRGGAERHGAPGEGRAAARARLVQRALQAGAVPVQGPEHRLQAGPRGERVLAQRAGQVRGRAGRRRRRVHPAGELVPVQAHAARLGRQLDAAELRREAVQGPHGHQARLSPEPPLGGRQGRHPCLLPSRLHLHIQSPTGVLACLPPRLLYTSERFARACDRKLCSCFGEPPGAKHLVVWSLRP